MTKKIHIIDYGVGNLFSVSSALKKIGHEPLIVTNYKDLERADFILLPGVGSFSKGMNQLKTEGFVEPLLTHVESGRPLLGICLGMQMLMDSSEENGFDYGLGFIPGQVKCLSIDYPDLLVPHIGWRKLQSSNTKIIDCDASYMYFVHSYHAVVKDDYVIATSKYGAANIASIVNNGNVWGCQFHPEKSGSDGLALLKNILNQY